MRRREQGGEGFDPTDEIGVVAVAARALVVAMMPVMFVGIGIVLAVTRVL